MLWLFHRLQTELSELKKKLHQAHSLLDAQNSAVVDGAEKQEGAMKCEAKVKASEQELQRVQQELEAAGSGEQG